MKSRKGVELILRHARDRLEPELAERIAPYRAGYTPAQRQDIQRRLSSGELLGVVATDALELGIDIGELDAAICVTFPGTVASLRQMWGRAGRRGRGLAVYIAGEDALDQFFCRHPDEFLSRAVEAAILDPAQPADLRRAPALRRARGAADRGRRADPRRGMASGRASELADAGFLRERATGFVPKRADDYPAARVALRSASADSFVLIDASSGRGARDRSRPRAPTRPCTRARSTCTSGAPTGCSSSTSRGRRALLEPFSGDYFTQAKRESMTYIERLHERREVLGVRLSFGAVVVLGDGARLPAQGPPGPRGDRLPDARPADGRVPDSRALVRARRADRRSRSRPICCSARCTRSSTARSRCCR